MSQLPKMGRTYPKMPEGFPGSFTHFKHFPVPTPVVFYFFLKKQKNWGMHPIHINLSFLSLFQVFIFFETVSVKGIIALIVQLGMLTEQVCWQTRYITFRNNALRFPSIQSFFRLRTQENTYENTLQYMTNSLIITMTNSPILIKLSYTKT